MGFVGSCRVGQRTCRCRFDRCMWLFFCSAPFPSTIALYIHWIIKYATKPRWLHKPFEVSQLLNTPHEQQITNAGKIVVKSELFPTIISMPLCKCLSFLYIVTSRFNHGENNIDCCFYDGCIIERKYFSRRNYKLRTFVYSWLKENRFKEAKLCCK